MLLEQNGLDVAVDALPTLNPPLRRRSWDMLCMIAADIFAVELALLFSCVLRRVWSHFVPGGHLIGTAQYEGLCFGLLALPIAYQCFGLYPAYGLGAIKRLRNRVYATFLVFGVLLCWNYAFENGRWSRSILMTTIAFTLTIAPMMESQARHFLIEAGVCGERVIVIGGGDSARNIIRKLKHESDLGLVPAMVLDDDPGSWGTSIEGVSVAGPVSLASSLAHSAQVALITLPELGRDALSQMVKELPFPRTILILDMPGIQTLWTESRDFGGLLGLELRNNLLIDRNRMLKRMLDCFIALPAFLLSLPLIVLGAIWVCLIDPGPPLFRQEREGEDGEPIHIWKLRTMRNNAEALLQNYLASNSEAKADWLLRYKLKRDPRIVGGAGHFLRKFSIDELPQLWNVLAGDMSLVGPRPFPRYHLSSFSLEFRSFRGLVAPGLTGLWQVSERSNADIFAQERLDTYYIRNWSLWLDIYILLKTFRTVLFPSGAY